MLVVLHAGPEGYAFHGADGRRYDWAGRIVTAEYDAPLAEDSSPGDALRARILKASASGRRHAPCAARLAAAHVDV